MNNLLTYYIFHWTLYVVFAKLKAMKGTKPNLPAYCVVPHAAYCPKNSRRFSIHGSRATAMRRGKLHLSLKCTSFGCEGEILLPMDWVETQLYFNRLGEFE